MNMEADLLAKYIFRLLAHHPTLQSGESTTNSSFKVPQLKKEFLAEHGFLL